MERFKRLSRTPFGSALLGGTVVAVVGLIAVSAGWVKADSDAPSLAPVPLTEPASDSGSAKGETVNQIYEASAPGVAFVQAEQPTQEVPFSPFGPQERSEEHTFELQSHSDLVCRLLLEKKKK